MLLPAHTTTFSGFGPCSMGLRLRGRVSELALAGSPREIRRQLRKCCPLAPGVYGMIDAAGQLVYVGKAKRLRNRLVTYFGRQAEGTKAEEIIEHSARLIWEPVPHEFIALVRELELIRRWMPRYNVQGQPGRFARAYLCIGRSPAPYVVLSPEPTNRTELCYGPLRSPRRLREVVHLLNHQFRLRDCPDRVPMVFTDQLKLFEPAGDGLAPWCDRLDMGTCVGPCAGGCSRSEYADWVRRARQFLDGSDVSLVEQIERRMIEAAVHQQYERAAMFRDQWESLDWLNRSLARLRDARRRYSFVYPVRAANGRPYWLAIARGQIKHAGFAPRCEHSSRSWKRRLKRIYSTGARSLRPEPEDVEMLLLITAWFRRFPDELKTTLTPAKARTLC